MTITPYTTLFEWLNQQPSTILTPNQRLSATLSKYYQRYQLDRKQVVWQTPDMLPLTTWIERLWFKETLINQDTLPRLLNATQEQQLWVKLTRATYPTFSAIQITETTKLMQAAWQRLKQWLIDPLTPAAWVGEQYATLAEQFQHSLHSHRLIDSASLPDLLREKITCGALALPKPIILVGFIEITPQWQALFEAVQAQPFHVSPSHTPATIHTLALQNDEEECYTMARFAKAMIQNEPGVQIGCVIPALDKKRARVMQIFTEICKEEAINMSVGLPLIQTPIIDAALQCLALHESSLSLETFDQLLHSPFLGHAESERYQRATFSRYLYHHNLHTITLPCDLIKKHCDQLDKQLKQFFTLLETQPAMNTHQQWATLFSDLLLAMGWPGERSLNSEEYQAIQHWGRLLETFMTLDYIEQTVSIGEALYTLKQMATQSIFHAKTPQASINLLGLLEAAGLAFDYLWVANMDDHTFPPQPKPHPLLSKTLQMTLNMPHVTFEKEYHYCQLLLKQFCQTNAHLMLSYATHQTERQANPSCLLVNFPAIDPSQLSLVERPDYFSNTSLPSLEYFTDDQAPQSFPSNTMTGGVGALKDQALCPFKAFATWRLKIKPLDNIQLGLRAKDKGSILHRALENIWTYLKNHHTLIQHTPLALQTLITDSIDEAIQGFLTRDTTLTKQMRYLSIEKKRLTKLLTEWLTVEKNRPPFHVLHTEQVLSLTLNHLTFNIRVDRIDQIDNKKLIIDYKSNTTCHMNDWLGDRPAEPQLPLYALIDNAQTTGIAFAQIAAGNSGFKGISEEALSIHGIRAFAHWKTMLTEWKTILTQLSDYFYQGIATVDPKDTQTCQYCQLQPLCRIKESL